MLLSLKSFFLELAFLKSSGSSNQYAFNNVCNTIIAV